MILRHVYESKTPSVVLIQYLIAVAVVKSIRALRNLPVALRIFKEIYNYLGFPCVFKMAK